MTRPPSPLPPHLFQILLALADRDLHGLGIMHDVLERSGGRDPAVAGDALSQPAAARARRPDRRDGGAATPEAGSPRYFRLTAAGRRACAAEAERLAGLVEVARARRLLPEGVTCRTVPDAPIAWSPSSCRGTSAAAGSGSRGRGARLRRARARALRRGRRRGAWIRICGRHDDVGRGAPAPRPTRIRAVEHRSQSTRGRSGIHRGTHGQLPQRHPLHDPVAPPPAGVHARHDPDAGARHRRQHRGLQRRQRRRAAAARLSGAGAARVRHEPVPEPGLRPVLGLAAGVRRVPRSQSGVRDDRRATTSARSISAATRRPAGRRPSSRRS